MLSVAKLSPGQEAYYERSVAAGIDDYYAGGGESPGVWAGAGAKALELEGVVGDGELGRLVGGRHPLSAAVLRTHPPRKQITVERIDPSTGNRYIDQKTLSPVAGYDLVFSPPKSVSVLHALGGPEIAHAIDLAHLASWQAALSYLEREACVTRRGKNGVVRETAGGFVAAAYRHRTSRANDPHLHTHVIVANMAQSPDGTWRALEGEALLRTHRLAAGYLYQAQLRCELTRVLGVEWERPEQGMAEIRGVPAEALQAFSQRRAQVLDYLERHGTAGFYAAKVAAVETRDRKESIDLPRLREEWRARAEEHGFDLNALRRTLERGQYRELSEHEIERVATNLVGPDGLTEKQATFDTPKAIMRWAEAHERGAPAERVLTLTDRFLADTQLEPIECASPGRPATYSTGELLRLERDALALLERGRDVDAPTVPPEILATVARERFENLDAQQRSLLNAICSSPDRVIPVVGQAGAGKTTGLAAVSEALSRAGVPTFGAAPSGIAAEQLGREADIPSTTLHRLLIDAQRAGGLPRRSVLVIDEASMADTRTLATVLTEVERADGKVVLVGDPEQLPAVGAAGLFTAIVARRGAVELTVNHRQRDESERRALSALREGESSAYLAHAGKHGRLVVVDDLTEAKARLVADWWNERVGVMIAYRRSDVADLNFAAHALMDAAGLLGSERLILTDGTEVATGDRIVCDQNDRQLGVVNGTTGVVSRIDSAGRTIVLQADDGLAINLPARYLDASKIRHAYALTGHKTQGLTVDRAFVLAVGHGSLKEWSYVALSRARHTTRLYTTTRELETEIPPAYRPEPPDSLEALAEAFTRPAAEPTALERKTRALADRRRELSTELRQAEAELRQALSDSKKTGSLGRLRHGNRRAELVTRRRDSLTKLDDELRNVNRELRLLQEQTRDEPRRTRSRERTRERDHGRELDHGR